MTNPEPYFSQIWLDKVDDAVLLCLQKATAACYTGHKVEDVLKGLANFELQLWRGAGPFVAITRVVEYPAGRQLELWAIGGKGYIATLPQVVEVLTEFAKQMGCKWVAYTTDRVAFQKVCAKFAPKTYTLMVQEV